MVFKNTDIKYTTPPQWPELAITKLWPSVVACPLISKYLPDVKPAGKRQFDREFFWHVVATAHPEYYKKLVTDAIEQRNSMCQQAKKVHQIITIKSEILKEILETPFFKSKSHKDAHKPNLCMLCRPKRRTILDTDKDDL